MRKYLKIFFVIIPKRIVEACTGYVKLTIITTKVDIVFNTNKSLFFRERAYIGFSLPPNPIHVI